MVSDDKFFTVALGKKLKEYRGEKTFTLDQLIHEARLSISRSSLSAIENGIQDISAKDLYAISTVLGFNLNDLMNEVLESLQQKKFPLNFKR